MADLFVSGEKSAGPAILQSIVDAGSQSALTTQETTITHDAPGTPGYAVTITALAPNGFSTADEGRTVLQVIANLQTRVAELETKLQALSLLD